MRLVTFAIGSVAHVGALIDEQVVDLQGAYAIWQRTNGRAVSGEPFPGNLLAYLQADAATKAIFEQVYAFAAGSDHRAQLAQGGLVHAREDVTFLPPIQRPG